jgi:hypothetical protein
MVSTAVSRPSRPLSYSGPAGRDARVDLIRGVAVIVLAAEVVVQMTLPTRGLFEATGTLSGLAFLVAAEGAVVGMLYRPRVAGGALGESSVRLWRNASRLYAIAIAVAVGTVALAQIPGIVLAPVTAISDDTAGRRSLLAAAPMDAADVTVSYPLDPHVVLDVIFLRLGPWPLDIVVVMAAVLVLAPAALWALARGKGALLLGVSGALYALELFTQLRVLPTRAEASLPILGWQAVFVAGLVAGYYRRELMGWFRTRAGRLVFAVLAAAAAAIILVPWFTEAATGSYPDLLARVAGPDTRWLFEPSAPGPLRTAVAVVLIVVLYGLFTSLWRPMNAALGWLLGAFGRHTTLSIVLLVAAAVVIVNIPAVHDVAAPLLVLLVVLAVRGVLAVAEAAATRKEP